MARILIVDDDASILVTLETWLTLKKHQVTTAAGLKEGKLKASMGNFDVVLLDVFLRGDDGLMWFETRAPLDPPVILISGHADLPLAVRAVKQGAFDFLEKPLDPERLCLVIDRAVEQTSLRQEIDDLKEDRLRQCFVQGPSLAMEKLVSDLKKVAPSSLSILIAGPSGSGKEGIAQAVHVLSKRVARPLVVVNCAAISASLFESELFGHQKGAFSGAVSDRVGFFVQADTGTLFLDEVGEIPLDLQPKLLRAIELGEIPIVGGNRPSKVDIRIVAATNRDLLAEVKAGRFREDLFFRLNQMTLRVPPLDERRDDIPVLVETFRAQFVRKAGRQRTILPDALVYLSKRVWKGNVRELRSVVERALVLSDHDDLDATAFAASETGAPNQTKSEPWDNTLPWSDAKSMLEKAYLERQLMKFEGKLTLLAQALEIHPNNLSRKLKELNIER